MSVLTALVLVSSLAGAVSAVDLFADYLNENTVHGPGNTAGHIVRADARLHTPLVGSATVSLNIHIHRDGGLDLWPDPSSQRWFALPSAYQPNADVDCMATFVMESGRPWFGWIRIKSTANGGGVIEDVPDIQPPELVRFDPLMSITARCKYALDGSTYVNNDGFGTGD